MRLAQIGIIQSPHTLNFDAQSDQNILLFLNTSRLKTMMQEGSQLAGDHTPVTGDTNTVGTVYGLDVGGSKVKASTSVNRPTLGSGTLKSYLTSNGTPLVDYAGSTQKYKGFHAVVPACSLRCIFFMSASSDGSSKTLMYTNAATSSSANYGLHIERTTGNKIRIRDGRGTSGTYMIDYTTTSTINVAGGVYYIQVVLNGTGSTAGTVYINSTAESFSILGGVDHDTSTNLTMFTTSAVNYAHIQFYSSVLSTQEITDYKTYNPDRDNNWFQVPRWHIDFSTNAYTYSDTGATTNVTNGNSIKVVKNKIIIPTTYFSEQKLTADTNPPIWSSSIQNSLGAAEFSPSVTTKNLIFSQAILGQAPRGRWMMAIVVKNRDTNSGSRFIQSTLYMVVTGKNYSGGIFPNVSYFVTHGQGGTSAAAIRAANPNDDTNVFFIMRDGDTLYAWNGLHEEASGTFTVDANYGNMGTDGDASGWSMDGYIYEQKVWYGCADRPYIFSEIDKLKSKWNC
jgi:hypothetical protein